MIQAARLAEEGRAFDQSDAGIANRPDSVDRAVARRVIDNQHVNVDIRLAQSAPDRAGDVSRAVVAPDEDVRVAHRCGSGENERATVIPRDWRDVRRSMTR